MWTCRMLGLNVWDFGEEINVPEQKRHTQWLTLAQSSLQQDSQVEGSPECVRDSKR